MADKTTAYDEVVYPSTPFPQAHPDRLATLGMLFGMSPAPPQQCTYLELGCGDGYHLAGLGFAFPESRFIGIDLSATAIQRGRQFVGELGLSNVELICGDVTTWKPPIEHLDYIVAHGLFSWVPPPVQECILDICSRHLAEQGIAYISYNTYPGGHIRQMLRDMMRMHTEHLQDPTQKIRQAKAMLQFLLAGQTQPNEFTAFLEKQAEWILESANDSVLYHDDLADVNRFFYFREFAALASQHDLQYLAEADFYEMQDQIYPPSVVAILQQLKSNIILKEQYLDFLKCRRFRQTLLCRAEIPLVRDIDPAIVERFYISSPARCESEVDCGPGVIAAFTGPRGAAMKIDHPLTKAALVELGLRWPYRLSFGEMIENAAGRLNASHVDPDDLQIVQHVLLAGYSAGLMELNLVTPTWVEMPGERPCISRLVRAQLRHGYTVITTLRHQPLKIDDPLESQIMQQMDGTKDQEQLAHLANGKVPDAEQFLANFLRRAAHSALLTG